MMNAQIKKKLIVNIPYVIIGTVATNIGEAWRMAEGVDASKRTLEFMNCLGSAFSNPLPSLYGKDIFIGIMVALIIKLIVYVKGKNAKKYRHNVEYGDAKWGNHTDIEPYIDSEFSNNVILSQTERITMNSRPSNPKYARNKNEIGRAHV